MQAPTAVTVSESDHDTPRPPRVFPQPLSPTPVHIPRRLMTCMYQCEEHARQKRKPRGQPGALARLERAQACGCAEPVARPSSIGAQHIPYHTPQPCEPARATGSTAQTSKFITCTILIMRIVLWVAIVAAATAPGASALVTNAGSGPRPLRSTKPLVSTPFQPRLSTCGGGHGG